MKLYLKGVPSHLEPGIAAAAEELGLLLLPGGIPVTVEKGDCLKAELSGEGGRIVWSREVEIFRGLAHLAREGIGCSVVEHACFAENGLMLDASRNQVPNVSMVKLLLRRMALMGMNLMMLYTEDTYPVEGYPYFGYLRGGYSEKELRELDDYAYALGVEMIPCIQTLGHSAMILRWRKSMGMLADTGGTLLVGEEETYRYIAQILKDASAPYRSRRIHIGMDESSDLGTGAYRARHGERPSIDVFEEHINRVMELTREQGLEPMIWSDMYFAHLSPTKDYDPEIHYPEEIIRKIPKDLSLVYWDYYHHSEAFYRGVIQQHRQSEAPVMFAGGLWNWCTPAVNEEHMLSTVLPALRACREEGVDRVFATAWGDDGAESVPLSLLYGLQVYAEFQYTGDYNEKELGQRFFALHKADPRAYLDLSGFDMVPKAVKGEVLAPNPAHFLLYEDPITLLFEKDLEGIPLTEHYEKLHRKYVTYCEEASPEYRLLWEFYRDLSGVLYKKCFWRDKAPLSVRKKDREEAGKLAAFGRELHRDMLELSDCWYRLWMSCSHPEGWDVLDIRMGALAARMKTAARRMQDFADGIVDTIPEMDQEKLPYAGEVCPWFSSAFERGVGYYGSWAGCVTASHLTN